MRKILVVGTKETNRSSIVESAMKGMMNSSSISHINLNNLSAIKAFTGAESLQDIYISLYDELDKKLKSLEFNSPKNSTVVIESFLTLNTKSGFVPLITDRFFKLFKPDAIVLLETPEESLKNHKEAASLSEQQKINRDYSVKQSSSFETLLKIVKVNPIQLAVAIRDVQDSIRSPTQVPKSLLQPLKLTVS
ncbi:MAG: hypothetical protein HY512_03275 [Candidatus Aenigmarchaeota archaeon]|nr:hypothetical protein [Candidatus Aenigmarchaeota archaeon]